MSKATAINVQIEVCIKQSSNSQNPVELHTPHITKIKKYIYKKIHIAY